jgi:hypothetical protein
MNTACSACVTVTGGVTYRFAGVILQDRQCAYKRNIEAHARNHCCRGKEISITYCECVSVSLSYPACKAHAPYYIVICGLCGSTIFFHIIS